MGIKHAIVKKLRKTTVLETFTDVSNGGDIRFSIVDKRIPVLSWKNTRGIEFGEKGTYFYSRVYLSRFRHYQPIYPMAQKTVDAYFKKKPPQRALVLGCAGCSIPRFLLMHYKKCRVTGIEYSKMLIDIAEKYFINSAMRSRFELINADAFSYVQDIAGKEKYDYIHTDIYIGDTIHPQTFSPEYLGALYELLTDNGLAMFNAFSVPLKKLFTTVDEVQQPFGRIIVLERYRSYFVGMLRSGDEQLFEDLKNRLPDDTDIIYQRK